MLVSISDPVLTSIAILMKERTMYIAAVFSFFYILLRSYSRTLSQIPFVSVRGVWRTLQNMTEPRTRLARDLGLRAYSNRKKGKKKRALIDVG